MTSLGIDNAELTAMTGLKVGRVWRWRSGRSLPLPENARIVADVLGNDGLWRALIAARSRHCPICADTFVDNSTQINARYCSSRCRNTAQGRRQRQTRGNLGQFAAARVKVYQDLLDKFCRECEPEGICREARCLLRSISPLPLSERRYG